MFKEIVRISKILVYDNYESRNISKMMFKRDITLGYTLELDFTIIKRAASLDFQ